MILKSNTQNKLSLHEQQAGNAVRKPRLPVAKICVIAGLALLMVFYWIIPSWLYQELLALQNSALRPHTQILLIKRIRWIEVAGVALGAVCFAIAIHDFLSNRINRS